MGRENSLLGIFSLRPLPQNLPQTSSNSTFYGNFYDARCLYCTKNKLRIIQDEGDKAVRDGLVEAARSTDLLLIESKSSAHFRHIQLVCRNWMGHILGAGSKKKKTIRNYHEELKFYEMLD